MGRCRHVEKSQAGTVSAETLQLCTGGTIPIRESYVVFVSLTLRSLKDTLGSNRSRLGPARGLSMAAGLEGSSMT